MHLLAPLANIRKAKAAFLSFLDLKENTNLLKKPSDVIRRVVSHMGMVC